MFDIVECEKCRDKVPVYFLSFNSDMEFICEDCKGTDSKKNSKNIFKIIKNLLVRFYA